MEERLARIGAGELLGLWAERKAAVGKAGATVAPPSAEPEPEAPGHEDDDEARPGRPSIHDRLWHRQSLFEEAMGGDADAGKVLRAIHKKVGDQQLGART